MNLWSGLINFDEMAKQVAEGSWDKDLGCRYALGSSSQLSQAYWPVIQEIWIAGHFRLMLDDRVKLNIQI